MRLKFIYLLASVLFIQQVSAQAFVAKVSAKVIGKRDVVRVEYLAQDVVITDFAPPPFINWNVAGPPEVSTSQEQTNNEVHTQTSYTFTLQPRATGRLIIPAATAKINGARRTSNSVVVEVRPQDHLAGARPAQPQTPVGSRSEERRVGKEVKTRGGAER